MLSDAATRRQLQNTFSTVLNQILDGTITSAPEGNGLDEQTNTALNELAQNLHSPARFTMACYDAFAGQLSGAHADEAEAEMMKLLGP